MDYGTTGGVFPTEEGRFILDTDASLFVVGGVLNQLQDDREVVIPCYPTPVLYYTSGNVGGGFYVCSLSFVPSGSAVHSAH